MKRITLGTLMLCPALLSAQPAELPSITPLFSTTGPAQSTSGSIPGALCPYVMAEGGPFGGGRFDIFAYIDGILTTGLSPSKVKTGRTASASPISMVNTTNSNPFLAGGIPLEGEDVIAFEVHISGFNNLSSTANVVFNLSLVTADSEDPLGETGATAMEWIRVQTVSEDRPPNVLVYSIYGDEQNQINSMYFDNSLYLSNEDSLTIGLYYDQATRRVGFVTDTFGDLGFTPATDSGSITNIHPLQEMNVDTGALMIESALYRRADPTDPDQPEPMFMTEFRTNASDFSLSYPAGTVDICGNEI
ncbi:MAG: hypothetical protein MI794_06835 [Pseudomonadales bacterium]|nr:hypothetical protein [Pseudomonadales bacterium]